MDTLRAREIVGRKSSIPYDGEEWDEISEAFDIAANCIDIKIKLEELLQEESISVSSLRKHLKEMLGYTNIDLSMDDFRAIVFASKILGIFDGESLDE